MIKDKKLFSCTFCGKSGLPQVYTGTFESNDIAVFNPARQRIVGSKLNVANKKIAFLRVGHPSHHAMSQSYRIEFMNSKLRCFGQHGIAYSEQMKSIIQRVTNFHVARLRISLASIRPVRHQNLSFVCFFREPTDIFNLHVNSQSIAPSITKVWQGADAALLDPRHSPRVSPEEKMTEESEAGPNPFR